MLRSAAPRQKKSPALELFYFPSRCRGDLPRSLMIDAGLEFKETRISKPDEWPSRKSEFIFSQMPVLKVDGSREIAQSHAIARYIAKLTNPGLLGDNADEAATVDMFYYQADDAFMWLVLPFYHQPVDTIGQLFDENWAKWMEPFERALTSSPYLANGKLSLADYHLLDVSELMAHYRPALLDQTPRVKAHREMMSARPGVAKFLDYVKGLPFTNSGHF